MRKTGTYQKIGSINYFIPHPLPPKDPTFELSPELIVLNGEANFVLGSLNEMSLRLPNQQRFIKAYVIKEALLSSTIEGIHTTLIDVFTYSINERKPSKDTQLVLNYTKALNVALDMMQQQNLPITSHVILQAHAALLSGSQEENKTPGQYRKQSVRVGELVPPPALQIPRLMSGLEKYINDISGLPPLIRAGLVHVHFETIHPFLDGNGRIGRLLIVLMLIDNDLLNLPILYPSYYFKKHHLEYYQKLDAVRTHGDFEGWITYYLTAIRDSAQDAYKRAADIENLEKTLKAQIQTDETFTKIRETATTVLDFLFSQPVTDIASASKKIGKAYNTISNVFKLFAQHNLLSEITINKRTKNYRFEPYLTLLEKEYNRLT